MVGRGPCGALRLLLAPPPQRVLLHARLAREREREREKEREREGGREKVERIRKREKERERHERKSEIERERIKYESSCVT